MPPYTPARPCFACLDSSDNECCTCRRIRLRGEILLAISRCFWDANWNAGYSRHPRVLLIAAPQDHT